MPATLDRPENRLTPTRYARLLINAMARGGSRARRSRSRGRSLSKQRLLWFRAEGERLDGTVRQFWIWKKGKHVTIHSVGGAPQPVHRTNRGTPRGVMHEIAIVYDVVKVRAVREEAILPLTTAPADPPFEFGDERTEPKK